MEGPEILLNIAGGVALLLWATRMVRTGILRAYGPDLRRFLGRATGNRLAACGLGIGVAGLLQSATATAMLLVSLAGRELIAVGPGLAVMLGADIGSTLVVQVLSLGIDWLSPAFILLGVIAFLSSSRALWRQHGRVLVGLGLMLLSLSLIVAGSEPLRDSPALQTVIVLLADEPVIALLLAAAITWVAHSSVAMVLLVMSLAVTGIVPPALALVLVLGANAGSAIIPMALAGLNGGAARRIPFGNLVFRSLGALLLLPFVGLLLPYLQELDGDPARQVANFHTAFNLALAVVFLPFTGLMARVATRLFPTAPTEEDEGRPRHLDPALIAQPTVALAGATRETMRMADAVERMLDGVIVVFRDEDEKLLTEISRLDDVVDALHDAIKLYLTQVSRQPLPEPESRRCIELITFTTNLEHVGDIIDKSLLELAEKKMRKRLSFSEQGWEEIVDLHGRVLHQMQLAMSVLVSGDVPVARQLIIEKERVGDLERHDRAQHFERLRMGRIESIESSALHLDILRDLKRINSHLSSVAYPILDAEGELRRSRLKVRPGERASGGGG